MKHSNQSTLYPTLDRETKRFYKSQEWRRVREQALIRDNYLCQVCLDKGIITDAKIVHHIIYLRHDFDKALDLDNLTSVCQTCHNKIHANDDKKRKNFKKKNKKIDKKFKVVQI
ncbi:HNH endonuclease signature motif containing protein [Staphylococcus gallinarum]|uniref:HNH endonuclease n=1 Tax=Staphylococcus gallinarum TaxID=1293 RepID=UPI00317A6268